MKKLMIILLLPVFSYGQTTQENIKDCLDTLIEYQSCPKNIPGFTFAHTVMSMVKDVDVYKLSLQQTDATISYLTYNGRSITERGMSIIKFTDSTELTGEIELIEDLEFNIMPGDHLCYISDAEGEGDTCATKLGHGFVYEINGNTFSIAELVEDKIVVRPFSYEDIAFCKPGMIAAFFRYE